MQIDVKAATVGPFIDEHDCLKKIQKLHGTREDSLFVKIVFLLHNMFAC